MVARDRGARRCRCAADLARGADAANFHSEAAFCWLHEAEIVARLDRQIDEAARGWSGEPLTQEQRVARLAEIAGERLMIEREEAALAEEAIERGVQIEHRADINPRAARDRELS